MQFTASDELRKKLEHAQDLMRNTARVSRATRRAVFERDGERCTFADAEGRRCRAHNALHAEQTFGKEHIARKIREDGDPRQRGYASESCDLAASGLVNMGFRRAEVQPSFARRWRS